MIYPMFNLYLFEIMQKNNILSWYVLSGLCCCCCFGVCVSHTNKYYSTTQPTSTHMEQYECMCLPRTLHDAALCAWNRNVCVCVCLVVCPWNAECRHKRMFQVQSKVLTALKARTLYNFCLSIVPARSLAICCSLVLFASNICTIASQKKKKILNDKPLKFIKKKLTIIHADKI